MSGGVVLRTLNRPQYVPTPETLISALAWEVLEYDDSSLNDIGWRYLGEAKPQGRPPIRLSMPAESMASLGVALREAGFQHERPEEEVAQAVANAIAGVRPAKGRSRAASPMTPALALMQNPEGMTGARNPANYASILEALYCLGASDEHARVADLWLKAAESRISIDPVLNAVNGAFSDIRAKYVRKAASPAEATCAAEGWQQTPFGWFHDVWGRLTSADWVSALPPRVWTDWATTVLRLALAMGFLWECERYIRVCRAAIAGDEAPSRAGLPGPDQPFELIPWADASLPPSSRNVRAIIRRKLHEGGRLRRILVNAEDARGTGDLDDTLRGEEFRRQVRNALNERDNPRYLQNLYETVVYSLLRRDLADHYGLLANRGNAIAVINPGTEWVAVVASLSAGAPSSETHVGQVAWDLARLGLQPRLPDLIGLLEAAGLARGSADADHGVRVDSAF